MTQPLRDPAARSGLTTWLASRVAVFVLTFAGVWMVADSPPGRVASWLDRWDRWDVSLYVKVARFGYGGYPQHYDDRGIAALFPGEPMLLRVVHVVVPNWTAAGLLISLVAGAVACVALARLGVLEGGPQTGSRAALYLVLSPYAVFLAAGYSEALFLALAIPAWLAARRRRWLLAGALAAGAAFVRVTGVFLAAALLVEFLVAGRSGRRLRDAVPLVLPWLVVAGYVAYLHAVTGDWLAWPHAQDVEWHRSFTDPWSSLHTTWSAATDPSQGPAYVWSFRAEIAAVAVGVALSATLAVLRRWAELVYVGGQVVALATSSFYLSVARASLLWWPLWLLLAGWSVRRRWLHVGYLALAPALMAVGVVAFTQGHWVG